MSADLGINRDNWLTYGRSIIPEPPRRVRAGGISALFDGADLRRVSIGGAEIVRRLYTAIRDVNWDTVVPVRSRYSIEVGNDQFAISYHAAHRKEELDLTADVTVDGRADGTVRFVFDGTANADFPYCRIGLCVLHPPSAAGRPYRADSPEGAVEGELPLLVGPQWIRDGILHALFAPYRRLTIAMPAGLEAEFSFEGDLFEMEDQRNWTDASFKTYSTPLALGFPRRAQRGQTFHQSVEIRCRRVVASVAAGLRFGAEPADHATPGEITLSIGEARRAGLPAIGLGISSVAATLTQREAELLRAAAPDHLRVEVRSGDGIAALEPAVRACEALGTRLEAALFLGDDSASELERLRKALEGVPVARFLVFREGSKCSDAEPVRAARARLSLAHPGARFLGGTNLYLAELNRTRPDPHGLDGFVFTVTPQVHDGDDMSVMENVRVQADAVRTARSFAGEGHEVAVSPITLKPRFNPFANRPLAADPTALPLPVDSRQASLFAAAWTVGSLKALIEGGAAAVTYYETVGWRGLIESATGSPSPEIFPTDPGMIFPVYWVFRDLAGWKDGTVLSCESSEPETVTALALRRKDRTRVLVANLTRESQNALVVLSNAVDGAGTITPIDRESYDPVPPNVSSARRTIAHGLIRAGRLGLLLHPYAVACVDV